MSGLTACIQDLPLSTTGLSAGFFSEVTYFHFPLQMLVSAWLCCLITPIHFAFVI